MCEDHSIDLAQSRFGPVLYRCREEGLTALYSFDRSVGRDLWLTVRERARRTSMRMTFSCASGWLGLTRSTALVFLRAFFCPSAFVLSRVDRQHQQPLVSSVKHATDGIELLVPVPSSKRSSCDCISAAQRTQARLSSGTSEVASKVALAHLSDLLRSTQEGLDCSYKRFQVPARAPVSSLHSSGLARLLPRDSSPADLPRFRHRASRWGASPRSFAAPRGWREISRSEHVRTGEKTGSCPLVRVVPLRSLKKRSCLADHGAVDPGHTFQSGRRLARLIPAGNLAR